MTPRLFAHPAARIAAGLIAPLLLLLWWDAQSRGGDARALAFASLPQMGAAVVELARGGQLLGDALATVSRALSGLVLGVTAGLALGIAMAMSRLVEQAIGPLYHAMRQVPLLGWLPLIGLWLGNGDDAKLLIVGLAAFYPTVLNSFEGIRHVEPRYLDVARVFGFSAWQRFAHVLLPAAAPLILTGISQALAFAWIATIGSELLLSAGSGLGASMSIAQAQSRMDVIIVLIVAVGLIGFSLNHLLGLARRSLLRWQPGHD